MLHRRIEQNPVSGDSLTSNRLNQYQSMWLFVFFDLPTETRKERKIPTDFRKTLLQNGFEMFQFSIYIWFCNSREQADNKSLRIKRALPNKGHIAVMRITDKQFGMIELFHGVKKEALPQVSQQLELF